MSLIRPGRSRCGFLLLPSGGFVGFLLLLLLVEDGRASEAMTPEDFLVQIWEADSGLPLNTVTSITQTPDGYLWVGTLHGGLARFDGVRFVNFHPGNTPALSSSGVQKLIVDAEGTLWVGLVDGALVSYKKGRFHFERRNSEVPQSWLARLVSSQARKVVFSSASGWLFSGEFNNTTNYLWQTTRPPDANGLSSPCADQAGVIWYRTRDQWLGLIVNSKCSSDRQPSGLLDPHINALLTDAAGRLWVGTEKEIAVKDGAAFVNMTPANGERDLAVRRMVMCSDGSLWVQTDHELRKCRDRQWITPPVRLASMLGPSNRPLNLFADSRGGVWLLRYGDDLWHEDARGQVAHVGEGQGLPNSKLVECWFEDREGNVWLGLTSGGLACVQVRTFHAVWPTEGLPYKGARSVCEDRNGTMWFGTSSETVLAWRDGIFTNFTLRPDKIAAPGFAWGPYTICSPGGKGPLWVGSVQNGISVLENGKFKHPFPVDKVDTTARVLYTDHAGQIWIGNEYGLSCGAEGKLKNFTEKDGFPHTYVSAITEDNAGDLWIGTAEGRLRQYHAGKFTSYRPKDVSPDLQLFVVPGTTNSLQPRSLGEFVGGENFLRTLYADSEGVLWIGTLGGGLLRFKNGEFMRYTSRDGLPSEYISQILEDQRGQLWLGTRGGVARASKRDLNLFAEGKTNFVWFITYGKSDGLPTSECSSGSQPACWRARDGRLWFATVKGAVWTDPAEVRSNPLPPPVVIEEISVDGQVFQILDGPVPTRLRIPPDRHYLEFRFTALSLTSPENIRFQWRLAGLEKDWSRQSSRRSVSYGFVPSGDYEFQVRACNTDGVWNEAGASIMLTALPYF